MSTAQQTSEQQAIAFRVFGRPQQQGSKAPQGFESNKNLRPWRAAVSAAAGEALRAAPLMQGPVKLLVVFYFARPKSHYGKGGLKPSAPSYYAQAPDCDKLLRAIGDSLTGVVIGDDRQIAVVHAAKYWTDGQARAEIVVEEMT